MRRSNLFFNICKISNSSSSRTSKNSNSINNSLSKYFIVILLLVYLISCIDAYQDSSRPVLKFRKDKTFKILQITDLHYGERDDWDELNTISEEALVEAEQPDYVMLSGDMLSAYTQMFRKDTSSYKPTWDKITEPMRKRNIPWSITFGNHDAEGRLNRNQLADLDMSYNLSLTQVGPSDINGVTNYVLEVQASDSDKLATLIYVFDSAKSKRCASVIHGDWGCVDESQVKWYQDVSDSYNRTTSFAYVHIPPIEVIDLWNTKLVTGDFGEKFACCFGSESELVKALLERGDVKTLYFGHDHKNDYHGDYFGLDMGYGRKSGYGSANPKYTQGARVLLIHEETLAHETWVRNVKGERDDQKVHKSLDEVPRYCCVGIDSKDDPSWGIYLALFFVVMVILFFIQWKMRRGAAARKKSIEYTKIQMETPEEMSEKRPSVAVAATTVQKPSDVIDL